MRRLPLRSPPRMRGKDGVNDSAQAVTGITPACAGKSMVRRSDSRRSQGSPPRMRGKVNLLLDGNIPLGITPAYAGKSPPPARMPGLCRDHPRVCGEKGCCPLLEVHAEGSPPRMRGKVIAIAIPILASGITPAYAGKSRAGVCIVCNFGDHPRVCGEKF